jgi:hypothetical protein
VSYDLIVRGFAAVPLDQLEAAFALKPWYEIDGDGGGVLLTNTDTGVYLTISPLERRSRHLCYAINYHRPRFFAVEALHVLRDLALRNGWTVYDSQRETPVDFADGPEDAILAAWTQANAALTWQQEPRAQIDAGEAERVWQWNYARAALQQQYEAQGIAIPKIFFVSEPGTGHVRTALMWRPGIVALAIPEADHVLYEGEVLDPRVLLEVAAYYVRSADGVPLLQAPRFSLLLSAIEKAKRGRFKGRIVPSDAISEQPADYAG